MNYNIRYTCLLDAQGFKNQKPCYTFFCAPSNMFAYTIVHLKWSFMHKCTLMCIPPCIYYKDKVNVRSIPLTINPKPSLGIQILFYGERNNRQVSCILRTKQPDNLLSTMFERNEHGGSFSVSWFKTARLLANILTET